MNNGIVNVPSTFWNFIQNNIIKIPIIQRDYAQGREDKVDLRSNFLNDIKEHLESKDVLLLDFVYGTSNNGIQPLDGQQRLTTLWLLHWYFAFRKGERKYATILRRFSYQTRISSREFIDNLCSLIDDKSQKPKDGIAKFIQNQTWFSYGWKQDPTIQAMLVMLSGTDLQKKDGIEIVFGEDQDIDCLELLYNPDCPIQFYYLALEGIKQSDDLYVKMNHRGEQLTDFENFKADWVGYMRKEKDLNKFVTIKNPDYILAKLDTKWSDLFWDPSELDLKKDLKKLEEEEKKELATDDLFFSFVKLFFADSLLSSYKNNKSDIEQIRNQQVCKYTSFKVYKSAVTKDTIENLKRILDKIPKGFNQMMADAVPLIKNSDFVFLPVHRKNDQIIEIKYPSSYKERILFHSICMFMICSDEKTYDKKKDGQAILTYNFKRWLRLSANIAFSRELEESSFPKRLELVKAVSDLLTNNNAWNNVYVGLGYCNQKIDKILEREVKKSKIILSNQNAEQGILNLEGMTLFSGWIDFFLETVCPCCPIKNTNCYHHSDVFERKHEIFKNNNWTKAGNELLKLFKACLVEYSNICSTFPIKNIEFISMHDGYQKTFSGGLEQSFREVIYKMLQGRTVDSIINEYKANLTSRVIGWFTPLILDDNNVLWGYPRNKENYGYIREKNNGKMYLYYKQNNNDKDIDLLAFYECLSSNYINLGEIKSVEKKNDKWHIVVENNGAHSYDMEKNYTSVTGVIS